MRIVAAHTVLAGKMPVVGTVMTGSALWNDIFSGGMLQVAVDAAERDFMGSAGKIIIGDGLLMTTVTQSCGSSLKIFNRQRPMRMMTLTTISRLHLLVMPLMAIQAGG